MRAEQMLPQMWMMLQTVRLIQRTVPASSAVTEVEVDTVDPSMTDAVSFDDIKVGDIVKITLDDEGNADTVTVLEQVL